MQLRAAFGKVHERVETVLRHHTGGRAARRGGDAGNAVPLGGGRELEALGGYAERFLQKKRVKIKVAHGEDRLAMLAAQGG